MARERASRVLSNQFREVTILNFSKNIVNNFNNNKTKFNFLKNKMSKNNIKLKN